MEIKNICCCENGMNCSQNVFRTICENCGIKTDENMMEMLNGISAGFGINGMCSAVIGGLCALGCVYSEDEMKLLRIMLFMEFKERFSSLNCGRVETKNECTDVIEFVQRWAEEKIRAKK